ncbi:MAG: tyrosine-type recombinase/integrase [Urechidicola sp.]|nr:tyrosine-type recombinase/integrase [Urechidicola sp.]
MIFYKKRFKEKLQKKGYAISSIESYVRRLEKYEQWCRLKQINKNESENKLAFNYLKLLQKKTTNHRTLNREIQPLKLYYKFFRKDNPFQFLYIKKEEQKINTNFFTKEELEKMYDDYPQNTIHEIRDKILLGFYVFQGIKSSEAKTIKLIDIDLIGYKILLKGDKRTNTRKIGLNIKQILLLSEYINIHRRTLLKRRMIDDLIVITHSKFAQQNLLQRTSEKLKKSVSGFETLQQLRASVISNWVNEYDLRKAQYLSGHRYISTTEKFIIKDIEGLQKIVDEYFPL